MDDPARSFRRISSVLLVTGLVTTVFLTGSFAFVQDADRSNGNTVTAGSVDPKLNEIGPATENGTTDETNVDRVSDTWEDYSHVNGTREPVNNTLNLTNPNTTYPVQHVNISIEYVQNDTSGLVDSVSSDVDQTAKTINITTLTYNGTEQVGTTITDANGNGRITLYDLASIGEVILDGGGIPVNKTVQFRMSLSGDAGLNSDTGEGDGIDFTLYLEYTAAGSWRDTDDTYGNTVQYE